MNLASTIIVFLGPFLGFDFPLSLIQLLWVNLVMDTLAGIIIVIYIAIFLLILLYLNYIIAIAYGGEPALLSFMKSAPVSRDSKIINPEMWSSIICNGLFIAVMSLTFLLSDSIRELFERDGEENQAVFLTGMSIR